MADKKISDLNVATALAGTEVVAIVQGGETKKVTVSNLRPYKIYKALISQTGTNAPTAIVLENTFGQVPTYSYYGVGNYTLTFTGTPLTDNKTIPSENSTRVSYFRLNNSTGDGDVDYGYGFKKNSTNEITIYSFSSNGSASNDVLEGNLIEIITYN
jgi:hypothetical protein